MIRIKKINEMGNVGSASLVDYRDLNIAIGNYTKMGEDIRKKTLAAICEICKHYGGTIDIAEEVSNERIDPLYVHYNEEYYTGEPTEFQEIYSITCSGNEFTMNTDINSEYPSDALGTSDAIAIFKALQELR